MVMEEGTETVTADAGVHYARTLPEYFPKLKSEVFLSVFHLKVYFVSHV